jgi:DNA-binding transcriptional MerR regulator
MERFLQQRIIPDVENLDTAMKIVRDVELAYHRTIEENISYWWAVEEDIIESYTKLMNQTDDERVKATLSKIIPDLKSHVEVLESMRENFKKILADVKNHGEMIQALYFEEPKQPVGIVVDEAKSKRQCEGLENVWETLNEAAAELGKQIATLPPDIGVSLRGVRALLNLCESHPKLEQLTPSELDAYEGFCVTCCGADVVARIKCELRNLEDMIILKAMNELGSDYAVRLQQKTLKSWEAEKLLAV